MTNAHDQVHVDRPSVVSRTVFVETSGVRSTDFRLSPELKRGLFDNGVSAATKFLGAWDFPAWQRTFGPTLVGAPV
jgi:NTE family protein